MFSKFGTAGAKTFTRTAYTKPDTPDRYDINPVNGRALQ
jgi:hypothetical protein